MYNAELIQASIAGRARTSKLCREAARMYSPIELPESVYLRISTRKKLFNFLQAFGINCQAVMHQFDISVPRDTNLVSRARKSKGISNSSSSITSLEENEFNF